MVELRTLRPGDRYRWSGLLFDLVSDEAVIMPDGSERRRVRYVADGCAGLARPDDDVEPVREPPQNPPRGSRVDLLTMSLVVDLRPYLYKDEPIGPGCRRAAWKWLDDVKSERKE